MIFIILIVSLYLAIFSVNIETFPESKEDQYYQGIANVIIHNIFCRINEPLLFA